jgi:hypothetical protein
MNKNFILWIFCAIILSVTLSCEKDYVKDDETDTQDSDDDTNLDGIHEDSADYIWDASSVMLINLNGTSITSSSTGVTIAGTVATITAAGTYNITGSLSNGQIIVNTEDEGTVRLLFNGVNITSNSSAPVYVAKAKKAVIYLEKGTASYLTDASTYSYSGSDTEPDAALHSKSNLTIFGEGSLTVKGNYKDGIKSKDGLIINSGKISVTAKDDAVEGNDYVVARNSNLTISAGGDGIKSDNSTQATLGFISLGTDTITIESNGDAISATTSAVVNSGIYSLTTGGGSSKTVSSTSSAKGIKGDANIKINGGSIVFSSADDALHSNGSVEINGGAISVATADDGIHAETSITINAGDINITKSYEAIESPTITVNDGNIIIVASNDGFNASKGLVAGGTEQNDGSMLTINGGNIAVSVTNGDCVDSNGNASMTGGALIVHGPASSPELALDYNGTFNISGGLIIGSGPNSGNMIEGLSTSSTQYSLKLILTSSLSASTLFHIQDESGNEIVTFQPSRTYNYIVFSSPNLKNGSKYYVYTGGSHSGTLSNGLYSGGTYTAGTAYTNFTISSIVTSIGTSSGGTPGGRP